MKQYKIYILFLLSIFLTNINLNAIELNAGWNLLGSSKNMVNIQSTFPNAQIVWQYKQDKWLATSPDGSATQALENGGFETFSLVNAGDAFWVKVDENTVVNIDGLQESDFSIDITTGWNLISLKTEATYDLEYYLNDVDIAIIWKYTDSTWSAYSSSSEITSLLNEVNRKRITNLKDGEGFWLYATKDLKIDFTIPKLLRMKNTSGTIDEMWNIELDIPQNQNVTNFDIAIHMVKKSSQTVGNFIVQGISLQNNNITSIDSVSVFAIKTTGTATETSYSSFHPIAKTAVSIINGKLFINLGGIINIQDADTIEKFKSVAEYDVDIYASKIDIKAPNLVKNASILKNYYEFITFSNDSQIISGTIKIEK